MSLSTAFQNGLDDSERYGVVLLTFEFAETHGYWTGLGTITFNSIEYNAGASVFDVDDIQQNGDGSVSELVLSLSAQPDKGLTTDVLVALYNEDWHLKPVTIQLGLIDPDTGALIGVTTMFRGILDTAPYEEAIGTGSIKAHCVSRSIDLSVGGNLYRNQSTQERFDPDDTSLDAIGTLNGATKKELYWGQA